MTVKIYKPAKNTMQSGRAAQQSWILEYDADPPRNTDPLMGWAGAGDTRKQVRLKFESCEDARAFAEKNNWQYVVMPEHKRRVKPRNYADNFRYRPPEGRA